MCSANGNLGFLQLSLGLIAGSPPIPWGQGDCGALPLHSLLPQQLKLKPSLNPSLQRNLEGKIQPGLNSLSLALAGQYLQFPGTLSTTPSQWLLPREAEPPKLRPRAEHCTEEGQEGIVEGNETQFLVAKLIR